MMPSGTPPRAPSASRLRLVSRLASLVVRAQHGTLPALTDLAAEYGVCVRTIRRDVLALELVMPVQVQERKRWTPNPG